mmetsp:Transcript_10569/g.25021  ORF Transcript_10569/g.25021 Transcript_10569/m.25021 type:complete len:266 (-) Transcript_10569:830-1627(-)
MCPRSSCPSRRTCPMWGSGHCTLRRQREAPSQRCRAGTGCSARPWARRCPQTRSRGSAHRPPDPRTGRTSAPPWRSPLRAEGMAEAMSWGKGLLWGLPERGSAEGLSPAGVVRAAAGLGLLPLEELRLSLGCTGCTTGSGSCSRSHLRNKHQNSRPAHRIAPRPESPARTRLVAPRWTQVVAAARKRRQALVPESPPRGLQLAAKCRWLAISSRQHSSRIPLLASCRGSLPGRACTILNHRPLRSSPTRPGNRSCDIREEHTSSP